MPQIERQSPSRGCPMLPTRIKGSHFSQNRPQSGQISMNIGKYPDFIIFS
ncbi:MAG: hypothetical protein WC878_08475 [Candidatus Paceibacterota bacterium]